MSARMPLLCLWGLFLVMSVSGAHAREPDRDQPIHVEADRVQIDDIRGISVYSGNVVYTQGSIRLEADTVHIHHDELRQLVRLEAFGDPVKFRQRLEGDAEDMRAHALRMEYIADPEELVLEHEAWIWREDVEFTGEFIRYDVVNEMVSAVKGEDERGRVHIVIPPQRSSGEPASGGAIEVR